MFTVSQEERSGCQPCQTLSTLTLACLIQVVFVSLMFTVSQEERSGCQPCQTLSTLTLACLTQVVFVSLTFTVSQEERSGCQTMPDSVHINPSLPHSSCFCTLSQEETGLATKSSGYGNQSGYQVKWLWKPVWLPSQVVVENGLATKSSGCFSRNVINTD